MNEHLNDTHSARMMQLAMMGFDVVPSFIESTEHGMCLMCMHGKGISFKAMGKQWEMSVPWRWLNGS